MANVKEVSLKEMVKIMGAKKNMTITEIAKASGREQSTLSNMLKRGNPSLGVISEIFEGMGEDVTFITSDGYQYKIKK